MADDSEPRQVCPNTKKPAIDPATVKAAQNAAQDAEKRAAIPAAPSNQQQIATEDDCETAPQGVGETPPPGEADQMYPPSTAGMAFFPATTSPETGATPGSASWTEQQHNSGGGGGGGGGPRLGPDWDRGGVGCAEYSTHSPPHRSSDRSVPVHSHPVGGSAPPRVSGKSEMDHRGLLPAPPRGPVICTLSLDHTVFPSLLLKSLMAFYVS